jgi:non-ribosomal peptide synthetase component E (peptide arylation enzyme)
VARGIRASDGVSCVLPNRAEAVILFHAVQRLCAVWNPIVPIYGAREIRFILRQAGSAAIVVPDRFRGVDCGPIVPALREVLVVDEVGALTHEDGALEARSEPRGPGAKEVEDLLFEHPQVRSVAIVPMPDARLGERACAFVVPADANDPPSLPELVRFLETHELSRRKLQERLEVVSELPLTASGKVQKHVLRERIARQLRLEKPA